MLTHERLQPLLIAILIIGVLLIVGAAIFFVHTSIRIENNIAYQIQSNDEEINPETTNEARGLVAADIERRELGQQRNLAIMFGGIGIALLGFGWLVLDFSRSRQKKKALETSVAATSTIG